MLRFDGAQRRGRIKWSAQVGRTVEIEIIEVQADDGRGPIVVGRVLSRTRPGGSRSAEPDRGQARRSRELVSRAFGLEHDPSGKTFFLRGEMLALGPQEYRLLQFLARHARQVLSAKQLLHGAWEHALKDDAQALHSSMHRLRKALGPVARAMVQRRNRLGYCFEPEPQRS